MTSQRKICSVCGECLNGELIPYNNGNFSDAHLFQTKNIVFCNSCGFGEINEDVDSQALNKFYATTYREPGTDLHIDFSRDKEPSSFDPRSFAQLSLAATYCAQDVVKSFLDIGPGIGKSFSVAKSIFDVEENIALELSAGASAYFAKAYNAKTYGSLSDYLSQVGFKADVVLASHSLEHFDFQSCQEMLSELIEAKKSSTKFVIEVPNVDLRYHRGLRSYDAPHLLFFSKQSLEFFLKKIGFEILFIETCGPLYQDSPTQNSSIPLHKVKSFLKKRLPKIAKRFIYNHATDLLPQQKFQASDPNFKYGGDRVCLRAIVK